MEEKQDVHPAPHTAETGRQKFKRVAGKVWHFLWHEDSVASWVANIILAFVLIKFIVYPVLGLVLGTSYPIVAVVSGSMQHDGAFTDWWDRQCKFGDGSIATEGRLYERLNISQAQFQDYSFHDGFNRGDLMILYSAKDVHVGDVLVYSTPSLGDPVIHRIIIERQNPGGPDYETKGDANCGQAIFEKSITQNQVLGKAIIRIPWLGWIKIGFVNLVSLLTGR